MVGYKLQSNPKMVIKLDMKKAIKAMTGKYNLAFRYNEYCVFTLNGKELNSVACILTALYNEYLEHKEADKILGLQQHELAKKAGLVPATIGLISAKLCPLFIYMNTPKWYIEGSYGKPVYHTINEYGIMVVQKLMEKKENGV